ncbi:uncharacterized protein LOC113873626 [Abrus precatorius]|uniref:Uncharacterized protein LOC113873626 n=1 Tax=Abrus precatorius TaxID=3816 RepID=A0A8B8MK52_ABRPR|nr:uncharacterized protein LOC113873626 [Abrus precatorius]
MEMESTLHVPQTETTSVWTDEKHLHFLNTMEASFVRTMLHRHTPLRLDRHLPDTSESTLDSKPIRRLKKHPPSDSMGQRARTGSRRTRGRSSQLQNSPPEQAVVQIESERESAACLR